MQALRLCEKLFMDRKQAYLDLHIAVFLFGFTAILGRLIEMNEMEIVWYRLLITCSSIIIIPRFIRGISKVPRRVVLQLAGIGIIVTLHWICFYGSIKYSNVTVALSVLSTAAFFTSLIEPLVYRTKIKTYELLLGLMIIPGMYLIFSFGKVYLTGIFLGLGAAVLAALFSVLNRKMVAKYPPMSITFIELGSGWIFLSLLIPVYMYYFPQTDFIPSLSDAVYLVLLAVLCTTVAYVLALRSLRVLTAFVSTLSVNLEPIYGIIMAFFIFQENEELNNNFYLGTAIILLSVFLHPLLEKRFNKL